MERWDRSGSLRCLFARLPVLIGSKPNAKAASFFGRFCAKLDECEVQKRSDSVRAVEVAVTSERRAPAAGIFST